MINDFSTQYPHNHHALGSEPINQVECEKSWVFYIWVVQDFTGVVLKTVPVLIEYPESSRRSPCVHVI